MKSVTRKPRPLKIKDIWQNSIIGLKVGDDGLVKIRLAGSMDKREATYLHAWLGKAIKYLESRKPR
jgi:hypothetical protein